MRLQLGFVFVRRRLRGLQHVVFGEQRVGRFRVLRIGGNALDGAHLPALGFVEMADALRALGWIDHVDLRPHRNCVVRALRLAHVAIDALVGNHEGHAGTNFPRKNNTL